MDTLETRKDGRDSEDDMARAKAHPRDSQKLAGIVERLRLTITDAEAFKPVFENLEADKSLTAPDVVEIAYRLLGGIRPKSRKAALTAIAQERMRLAHAKSKGESAKIRVW